jgi:hypothetical protein
MLLESGPPIHLLEESGKKKMRQAEWKPTPNQQQQETQL